MVSVCTAPVAVSTLRMRTTSPGKNCTVNGHRLFYGRGPVSWSSATAKIRTRNPYSNYGYYFLSDIEGEPLTVDSATFMNEEYVRDNDYHSLHEVDNYAWYEGGRNLVEYTPITSGNPKTYTFKNTAKATKGTVAMTVTAGIPSTFSVTVNGKPLRASTSTYSITIPDHYTGNETSIIQALDTLTGNDSITVTCVSGGPLRLDYICMTYDKPRPLPDLSSTTFPVPEYVYGITNQDHHADKNADLVIITSKSNRSNGSFAVRQASIAFSPSPTAVTP